MHFRVRGLCRVYLQDPHFHALISPLLVIGTAVLQLAKSPGWSRQRLNLPKSDRCSKSDLWIAVGENRKPCNANEAEVSFIKSAMYEKCG